MNKWLTSSVDSYIKSYGSKTMRPVIYEVGSRDGKDGVELAQRIYEWNDTLDDDLWHDSTIVLFECNPPHIKSIQQNYPKATLITDAISDTKATVSFLQIEGDKDFMGSSSMDLNRVNYSWVKKTNTIEVQTRRLDDVIKELGHQKTQIDIMKIDIEGYTMEALLSLGKYLRNVRVFHLETEIEGHARKHTNLDIALFMQQHGYICTALENEWGESIQDQVWVRSENV